MTDSSDCAIMVRVGPPVVTSVTMIGERPPGPVRMAFPEGAWFETDALATIFGVSKSYIHVLLSLHKDKLGPPVYQERPRWRKRRRRLRRIVSEADYDYLRTLFPVVVGPLKGRR